MTLTIKPSFLFYANDSTTNIFSKVNIALLSTFLLSLDILELISFSSFNLLTNIVLFGLTYTRMNKLRKKKTFKTWIVQIKQQLPVIFAFDSFFLNEWIWSIDVNIQTKCRFIDKYHYGTSNHCHSNWIITIVLATSEEYTFSIR